MIQNVLLDTLRAERHGEQYFGKRKERIFKGKRLVSPQGLSEQVIADMIEDRYGYKRTTAHVNRIRQARSGCTVRRSTV